MQLSYQKKNNRYGWYIAILSALFGCTLTAGYPQFSLTIDYLAEQMQVSQDVLLTGDTVKSAAVVLAMWLSNSCYRRVGLYGTILLGAAATIVPQFLFPFTTWLPLFFLLKFIQGLSSIVFPVMMLLMMDWLEENKTGLVTAVFNGIFYGGGGIGATAAGLVLNKWGWVATYFALGIALAVVTAIWVLTVRERKAPPAPAADPAAAQAPAEQGLTIPQLLRLPKVYCLILGFIPTTFVVQAISADLAIYGSFLGYDELQVGSLGTAATIGMVAACLVSGKCSDFFAARMRNRGVARVSVMLAGCALTVVSVAFLLFAAQVSYSLLYAAVVLFSFGGSWGLGVFYSILPDVFDARTLPTATGFIGGFGDLMMPISPTIVGVIFGVRGLWTLGWGSCALLGVIGVLGCFVLVGILKKEAAQSGAAR